MFHGLGSTRSSLKADHLLQTPDTFIRTPLPSAPGVDFIVHAAPRMGAGFSMMTAEFSAGSALPPAMEGVERFVYVLDGTLFGHAPGEDVLQPLRPGDFVYAPASLEYSIESDQASKAVVVEKRYQPCEETARTRALQVLIGSETDIASEALDGDEGLQVRHLMPDGPGWDFAVNTMTYAPGAALSMVEVHVMEHGLLMLEGGGIYRLGDSWYPVAAGDFIWMAPYCPQWFGALGKVPAKYLIYKDWYRHPLAEA